MTYEFNVGSLTEINAVSDVNVASLWNGISESALPHIGNAQGAIKKSLWRLMTCICCGLMMWYMVNVFLLYFSYPVEVEIKRMTRRELTYPAVTICNMNPVKASAAQQVLPGFAPELKVNKRKKRASQQVTPDPLPHLSPYASEQRGFVNVRFASIKGNERERRSAPSCTGSVYAADDGTSMCYFVGSVSGTYNTSLTACESEGGNVAVIDSQDKADHVADMLLSSTKPYYWLYLERSNGVYSWMDYSLFSWTNWAGGEPSMAGDCVSAHAYNTTWRAHDCHDVNGDVESLCQKQQDTADLTTSSWGENSMDWTTEEPSNVTYDDTNSTADSYNTTLYEASNSTSNATSGSSTSTGSGTGSGTGGGSGTWVYRPPQVYITTHTIEMTDDLCPDLTTTEEPAQTTEAPYEDTTTEEEKELTSTMTPVPLTLSTTIRPQTTPSLADFAIPTISFLTGSRFERPVPREDFRQQEKVTEIISNLPDEEKSKLGYTPAEFILDCQYSGYKCSPQEDFAQFYNSIHGNCYIFNSGWNNTRVVKSYKAGRRYGLKLLVNIGQEEYTDIMGESAGARILVHPQNKMPFPEDEGFVAKPNKLTSIGLRKMFVQRRGGKYGNCTDIHQENHTRSIYEETYDPIIDYSITACFKTCYQRAVIAKCNCADPYYPKYGKAFGYKNISSCNTANITQDDCKYEVEMQYINNDLPCSCPTPCDDEYFFPEISTAAWPSDVHLDQNSTLYRISPNMESLFVNDTYKKNLLKIEVYFEEFHYDYIHEIIKYSEFKFMSDIGGILGLFLGFSILSSLEFVEFCLDFLVLMVYRIGVMIRRGNKKQATKNLLVSSAFVGGGGGVSSYDKMAEEKNAVMQQRQWHTSSPSSGGYQSDVHEADIQVIITDAAALPTVG